MTKYIATTTKVLSVYGRSFYITEGMEVNENAYTQAFPRYFKEVGTYTEPAHLAVPVFIETDTPEVIEELVAEEVAEVVPEVAEEVVEVAPEVVEEVAEEVVVEKPKKGRKPKK